MLPLPADLREVINKGRITSFGQPVRIDHPLETTSAFTRFLDRQISAIYASFIDSPAPDPSVCLVALGGYGRQEMFPYSDIDMLVLHGYRKPPMKIESAVRYLWDIGLDLGCVVRSLPDCSRILGVDIATDTAYLDCRYLCGNRVLFDTLVSRVVLPYFRGRKKWFQSEMVAGIREGVLTSQSPIYRIEPNLKNGVCGLRDCQRVIWSEKARYGIIDPIDVLSVSDFLRTHREKLANQYSALAGLRIELHCLGERRIDILETHFQPKIAIAFGLGTNGAGKLMERYFMSVREINQILLEYLEHGTPLSRLGRTVAHFIGGNRTMPGVILFNGTLYPAKEAAPIYNDPAKILNIFKQAVLHQAHVSVDLCDRIGLAIKKLAPEDFRKSEIETGFRDILSYHGPIGSAIRQMHDTGMLGRLIPMFELLTCKVEYDSYHEYTVDQHVLMALSTFDRLESEPDAAIGTIARAIPRRLLIRLAILLHDVGKAVDGDHAVHGAIITETVCERLGLSLDETERVRFLVHSHLDLYNLSVLREPEEPLLKKFAATVEDRENLDMLYLLTIVDIRSVGQKTWTAWKAYQLETQYKLLQTLLDNPDHGVAPHPIGLSYDHDVLPEDRELHQVLLSTITGDSTISITGEEFHGFERITVAGRDRLGFLSNIIGCISSEGYNILSARIYTLESDKALDVFYVEPPESPTLELSVRVEHIRKKWDAIRDGSESADSLMQERSKKYPQKKLRGMTARTPAVTIDNNSVQNYTILEIDTPDKFGLLHRIANCMSRYDINIVSARLSTRADLAVDVFYISGPEGGKLSDRELLKNLTDDLQKSLTS